MQKHISELVLISVLTLTVSCKDSGSQNANASPSPSPKTPAEQAAEAEAEFQVFWDADSSIRTEARQTAIAFVARKLPDWKVKGLSSQIHQDNTVWVAVDIEKGGRSVVLNLAVRKFFPESGDSYWKAVLVDRTLRQQLHDMNDADLLKQLNDAKDELESLKNREPEYDEPERPDPR